MTKNKSETKYAGMKISEIAAEFKKLGKVSPYAEPYIEAMDTMDSIDDMYGADKGSSIIAYFLSNATQFKGEEARELKKELNARLKNAYKK